MARGIVVEGGGISADIAALAFDAKGWRVIQPEGEKPGAPSANRYFALGAGAVALLRDLEIWGELSATTQVRRMHLRAANAAVDLSARSGQAVCTIVSERQLREAIAGRKQRSNIRCEEVSEAPPDSVRLDARVNARARARIGHVHTASSCLVETERDMADCAAQVFSSQGIIGFLPVSQHEMSMIFSGASVLAQTLASLSESDFSRAIEKHARFLGAIRRITPIESFPIRPSRAASPLGRRRLAIGDGNMRLHPLAGQGLNLALATIREASASAMDPAALLRIAMRQQRRNRLFWNLTNMMMALHSRTPALLPTLMRQSLRLFNAGDTFTGGAARRGDDSPR